MISGVGIHSGRSCRVRLHREGGPLRFRRGRAEIGARLEQVVSTSRSVTLGSGSARVATVEHLLAALHARGFWSGVVIEASAEELPILDGSAAPWLEALAELGEPPEAPEPLSPVKPLLFERGDSSLEARPGGPSLEVEVDYPHPAIGRQCWRGSPAVFGELLEARTFGFLSELAELRSRGLAAGAGTENAIVFDDSGPLRRLRFADEPVRHKALDLVGDLMLLGRPLRAQLRVSRGSHALHVDFMRDLIRHHSDMASTR